MEGHNMIENGFMDLDEKTPHQSIALARREATEFIDIIPFGEVSQVAHHGWVDHTEVDTSHAKVAETVIALNILHDHRVAGLRRIFLEMKQG
jgi:hypothetical protein